MRLFLFLHFSKNRHVSDKLNFGTLTETENIQRNNIKYSYFINFSQYSGCSVLQEIVDRYFSIMGTVTVP